MKISPINHQSFKAYHPVFKEDVSNERLATKYLNHTTYFFRYGDLDEFLIEKLKRQSTSKELQVLSLGCSYGEEVYSYAMGFDGPYKARIVGLDLSQRAIDEAKDGRYKLTPYEKNRFFPEAESEEQTLFENRTRNSFKRNFLCVNQYQNEWVKKKESFKNCEFKTGNILDLENMFEPNSQDLILCRYVLYHLNLEDQDRVLEQIYKVLKPGGLLCVEPNGFYGISDFGFKQISDDFPCVVQKPKFPHKFSAKLHNLKFDI